jgi:hypothetical protein
MDDHRFETELPVSKSAIYYILTSYRAVSIWDEKKGNTPANSSLNRGVGSKVYLNKHTESRDQDRVRSIRTKHKSCMWSDGRLHSGVSRLVTNPVVIT